MDEKTAVLPEVPAEIREAARQAGGGWLDEVVTGRPSPTASAVRGSWQLDANGELTGEYAPNPDFGKPRRPRCPYAGS